MLLYAEPRGERWGGASAPYLYSFTEPRFAAEPALVTPPATPLPAPLTPPASSPPASFIPAAMPETLPEVTPFVTALPAPATPPTAAPAPYAAAGGVARQEWLRGMTGRSRNVSESPKLDRASRTPIDNRLASRLAAW